MKKEIHGQNQYVTFTCASCSSKFEIKSTLKSKDHTVDICSKCHPFYTGSSSGQQVKGRAEQFNKKIVAGAPAAKVDKKQASKKENKKIVKSLDSL